MKLLRLSALPPGKEAFVEAIELGEPLRLRLLELGLIPGTRVTCLHHAPSGSPIAYRIRGAAIALRSRDARLILVTPWD